MGILERSGDKIITVECNMPLFISKGSPGLHVPRHRLNTALSTCWSTGVHAPRSPEFLNHFKLRNRSGTSFPRHPRSRAVSARREADPYKCWSLSSHTSRTKMFRRYRPPLHSSIRHHGLGEPGVITVSISLTIQGSCPWPSRYRATSRTSSPPLCLVLP